MDQINDADQFDFIRYLQNTGRCLGIKVCKQSQAVDDEHPFHTWRFGNKAGRETGRQRDKYKGQRGDRCFADPGSLDERRRPLFLAFFKVFTSITDDQFAHPEREQAVDRGGISHHDRHQA